MPVAAELWPAQRTFELSAEPFPRVARMRGGIDDVGRIPMNMQSPTTAAPARRSATHCLQPSAGPIAGAESSGLACLLTVEQVAQVLQVSQRTVRRWTASKKLPVVQFGRSVRIRPADLDRMVAAGGLA